MLGACANNGDAPLGLLDNEDPSKQADTGTDRSLPSADDASSDQSSNDASFDSGNETGPKDSGFDADATVDAGDAGPTTSLFFLGDFAVNNTVQLGRALLPTSSAAALTITDGVHTAHQVVAFDTLANGTKIVVATDLTVLGRFDLVVANANGSGAVVLATMSATGGVSDLVISPDGTKVAYVADVDTDGAMDVYVVPIAGAAAPVRVSPRPTADAALDAQSIAWSRDSVYLAMAGDFTVDKKNELFVVDTTAAVPVPVAALAESALPPPAGTGNVGLNTALRPIWTSSGTVCVKADLTGLVPAVYRLYCAAANGTGFAAPAHFPAAPAQLGSYGISPDGATLAFAADSKTTDAYEIYTMPADDSAAPTLITSGTITVAAAGAFRGPAFAIPLLYSPDALKIGFVADILVDNRNELYVVAADGATAEKRVAVVGTDGDAERDVQTLAWSTDSLTLAFVCDHRANNDFEVFRIPNVTTANQIPVLVKGVVVSGDVTDLQWRP